MVRLFVVGHVSSCPGTVQSCVELIMGRLERRIEELGLFGI